MTTVITCYVPGDVYGECDGVSKPDGLFCPCSREVFNATNHVITGVTPLIVTCGETVTIRGTNFRPGTLLFIGQYQIDPEVR